MNHIWIRERFNATGPIDSDTALSSLPRGAPQDMINEMIVKLETERGQVRTIIKDEVEALMHLGADFCKMS